MERSALDVVQHVVGDALAARGIPANRAGIHTSARCCIVGKWGQVVLFFPTATDPAMPRLGMLRLV